jgi:hypothetical protein
VDYRLGVEFLAAYQMEPPAGDDQKSTHCAYRTWDDFMTRDVPHITGLGKKTGYAAVMLARATVLQTLPEPDLRQKRMYKEAVQELEKAYSLFGLSQVADSIRQGYEAAGYRGAIQQWAEELEHRQATHQAFTPGSLAAAYAILGDKDRAFYWLDQAYEHREMDSIDGGVYFLPADPMYESLRSDPRYKALLRRVGLPP